MRNTALPEPGSELELQVLAGRVFSHHLRRDRPLWETWLVEGLDRDRFAILSKTHHALVDGVSGLDILSVLFAPDEEQSRASLPHWMRHYNQRRNHSALGNRPPIERVREVTGLDT